MAQDIPAKLAPPAGTSLIGAYAAKGVQIYACSLHGTTNAWSLKAPEAQLFDAKGVLFAKHYAGPTWEANDGSKIVGRLMETVPGPVAGDIPWLLLSATSTGQGVFAGARFVQRIKTAGGVGTTGKCSTPGAERRVSYSAEYAFFK
jgi:hypothetical protein